MEYDFIQMGAKGVNWAQSLRNYQRILNEDPKEVLAYKTPFEVYFACKCNSYSIPMTDDEVVENAGKCDPSKGNRRWRSRHASHLRKQVAKATDRCSERMVRGHLRSHPPSKYVGEKVYARLPRKGGIKDAQNGRYVIEVIIIKRNVHRHAYKVAYTSPVTGKKEEKWLPVDDITSLTLGEEKRKQRLARLSKKRKKAHHSKYYIPMEPDDYKKTIEDQGFVVQFNPPGDGSCQFAALAYQLSLLGIFRSPETMRKEIVSYLEKNAVDGDGFLLLEFLPEFTSWEEYLEYMARSNTFGDQTTLFAAANLYNINIQVISTLGPGAQHLFEPSSSAPMATVYLGHFAAGEHYVSLMPRFSDGQNGGPECENGSGRGTGGEDGSGRDTGGEGGNGRDTGGEGGSGRDTGDEGGSGRGTGGEGGSGRGTGGEGGSGRDTGGEGGSGRGTGGEGGSGRGTGGEGGSGRGTGGKAEVAEAQVVKAEVAAAQVLKAEVAGAQVVKAEVAEAQTTSYQMESNQATGSRF